MHIENLNSIGPGHAVYTVGNSYMYNKIELFNSIRSNYPQIQ